MGPVISRPSTSKVGRFASVFLPGALVLGGWASGCGPQAGEGAPPSVSCAPCASASPASPSSASPGSTGSGPAATASVGVPVDAGATLAFRRDGAEVRTLSLRALAEKVPPQVVVAYDPYYNREKRFRALPIAEVLAQGFAGQADRLVEAEFVLRAKDGYTVAMRGSRLLEGGGFVAYEDLDAPGWEPIGPQRANPAPLYFIWSRKDQTNLETHPRPWQLAAIEIVRFEDAFPKTVPTGLAEGDPGWKGFALYKEQCVHCHAINRQGGRVGPELNVPKNVTEYRPVDQIKAYIKNPLDFRYSAMPPHPSLTDENLDQLVAYLRAMGERKQDGDAAAKVP